LKRKLFAEAPQERSRTQQIRLLIKIIMYYIYIIQSINYLDQKYIDTKEDLKNTFKDLHEQL